MWELGRADGELGACLTQPESGSESQNRSNIGKWRAKDVSTEECQGEGPGGLLRKVNLAFSEAIGFFLS